MTNKKIILGMIASLLFMSYSCQEGNKNLDLFIPSTLEVIEVKTLTCDYDSETKEYTPILDTDSIYHIGVIEQFDTVWHFMTVVGDTLKDEDGIPIRDENNKVIVENLDTTWHPGDLKTRMYRTDTLVLDGQNYSELQILVHSNARWTAPLADFSGGTSSVEWSIPTVLSGNGNSIFKSNVRWGLTTRDRGIVNQYIFTRDSLVMYEVPMMQLKRRK